MRDAARYEPVEDPCGLWTVWDDRLGQPATFACRPLIGLSESEAREAHAALSNAGTARVRGEGHTAA